MNRVAVDCSPWDHKELDMTEQALSDHHTCTAPHSTLRSLIFPKKEIPKHTKFMIREFSCESMIAQNSEMRVGCLSLSVPFEHKMWSYTLFPEKMLSSVYWWAGMQAMAGTAGALTYIWEISADHLVFPRHCLGTGATDLNKKSPLFKVTSCRV